MRACDLAGEVGDGGDQRRPDLGRGVGIGPVITPRMKSQSADFLQGRDAAFAQIHLGNRARNRL
jgi:hypothetical protein